MRKIIQRYFFCFLLAFLLPHSALALNKQEMPKLLIFYSPGCHKCIEVETRIIPAIEREFRGQFTFEYLDVGNPENYKLFLGLMQKSGSTVEFKIPVFYLQGRFLNSQGQVEAGLRNLIKDALRRPQPGPGLRPVDLIAYFKSFVPLSVIIAGLEDGINPCAFTVIVFFISFLALQGYRKRELFFYRGCFYLSGIPDLSLYWFGDFQFLLPLQGFLGNHASGEHGYRRSQYFIRSFCPL